MTMMGNLLLPGDLMEVGSFEMKPIAVANVYGFLCPDVKELQQQMLWTVIEGGESYAAKLGFPGYWLCIGWDGTVTRQPRGPQGDLVVMSRAVEDESGG